MTLTPVSGLYSFWAPEKFGYLWLGKGPVRTVAWIDAFRGAVRTSGGQGLHLPSESHAGTLMRSALVGRASLFHPSINCGSQPFQLSDFLGFEGSAVSIHPLKVKPSVGI